VRNTLCNRRGQKNENVLSFDIRSQTREYELREPIPHIGLCPPHEPRSSIFKRNVIDQIIKTLKTQIGAKCRRRSAFDLCGRRRWFGAGKNSVNMREGIGISNVFLKIARWVEPPHILLIPNCCLRPSGLIKIKISITTCFDIVLEFLTFSGFFPGVLSTNQANYNSTWCWLYRKS